MFKRFVALALSAAVLGCLVWALFSWLPGRIEGEIYRREYTDEVERYSAEFGVDPSLVYSVIKVESNFNPDAKSDVGAIGLMQIIEDSFDWVSKRLGREDLVFSDMYTPEYSIMFGCYMLSFLYNRYGNIELTAAAYHSGMTAVDSWIESGEIDPENPDIADIKGANTAHYVGNILKAYEKYSSYESVRKE